MESIRSASKWVRRKRIGVFIIASLAFFAFRSYYPDQYTEYATALGLHSLPCRSLPGANDVFVVMRTGVTQIEGALSVHLDTTLKCPPESVIFSDHAELYQGKYEIRDVLANVNPTILQESDEFELYRKVKAVGREGLELSDITGSRTTSKTDKDQKIQIAGWVLDKWKFLPMVNETFHLRPNQKWYIFIETDTYLFWSTTLKYLATLDHTEPIALGHRSTVKSPYPFMHGGSGFMISNPAMRRAVDYIETHREELDEFVAMEWAGDIALAYVFEKAGVPLTGAWPIYKPHTVGVLDFGLVYEDKRFWCYPAGSFHHMTPEGVEDLWNYEQQWIKDENKKYDSDTFIRHSDVFNDFVLPRIRLPRDDWDNQSSDFVEGVDNVEDCNTACLSDEYCMQYMFNSTAGECMILDSVRLGEAAGLESGLYSDWIFDRIEQWRDSQPPCEGEYFLYDSD